MDHGHRKQNYRTITQSNGPEAMMMMMMMMKKKNKKNSINKKQELVNAEEEQNDERGLEIVKAVAQAWYSHSEISMRPMNEFDARKISFRGTPTRFKLEAARERNRRVSCSSSNGDGLASWTTWDFGRSLWDSYELVTVSKRLEAGLVLDGSFSEVDGSDRARRKRKESNNSLRRLFSQMSSSRRFSNNCAKFPRECDL